jgi:hypothetical protein
MFALSPVAITPATLTTPPSAVALPAADLVSTRLTPAAVPAPLANVQLKNDTQGQAQVATANNVTEEASAQTAAPSGTLSASLSASGDSSAYLAQLFSQNEGQQEDAQIVLTTQLAHFAPALQYNTFVGYGVVKYRPSDAGLPSTNSAPASAATTTGQSDAAPLAQTTNDYQAYSTTQSRNQSNLADTEPQLVVAG